MDFEEHDSLDVARVFENKLIGSYYNFLVKYEPEYDAVLSKIEVKFIEFISQKLALGKRVHELIVLRLILSGQTDLLNKMKTILESEYQIRVTEKTFTNVANILMNEFPTGSGRATFKDCVFISKEVSDYKASDMFIQMLEKNQVFKEMINELIEFGLYRNQEYYGKRYLGTSFQLYQKYSYEDVCRLLEWEHNEVALNIGGYKYDEKSKTYPVFINYEKANGIEASINYEDRFISPSKIIALSKARRTVESNDVVTAYNAEKLGVSLELFVRKNKDDKISKEFYYFGRMHTIGKPEPIKMKITGDDAVEIMYQLETQVREDLYEYLTEE